MTVTPSDLERATALMAERRWADARDALDVALAGGEDPEARFARGVASWWLDDVPEGMRDWERAYVAFRHGGAFEQAVVAAVYLALASSMSLGNTSAARGWTQRAARLASDHDLGSVGGWVALCQAHFAIDEGHPEAGQRYAEAALTATRDAGDTDLELCLLSEIGMALVERGRADEGLPLLDEAMAGAMAGEARDPDSVVLVSCRSITASTRSGDVRRATQWIRAADDFYERHGSAHLYTTCRLEYGNVLFATGRWDRAERELEAARQGPGALEPALQAAAAATLAELRVAQGRLEEAARLVAGLDDHSVAARALAIVRLRLGEARAAATILRRRLREIDDGSLEATALQDLLAETEIASGNAAEAHSIGDRLLHAGGTTRNAMILARAHRTIGRAHLAAERAGDAVGHLDTAVAGFGRLGLPYDAAISRALLARAAAGVDRDLAVSEGRAAMSAFEDLGATRDADATAALLRALGVRAVPRSDRTIGTLTRREREVLGLLGEGLSNREIGDRLFITRKTVEHHVAAVLGKLGLTSRSEAAVFAVRSLGEDQPSK